MQLPVQGVIGRDVITCCPCEERHIGIQILRKPEDAFWEQPSGGLKVHDSVAVEGPCGEFVLEDSSVRLILFVASGSAEQLRIARDHS